MKKLLLILSILIFTACTKEEIDSTSSATGKWDSSGSTKATLQFQKIKSEKGESQDEIITTVRPAVLEFVERQFSDVKEVNLGELNYSIPSKVITTSTDDEATHIIRKVGFDFDVKVKILNKTYSNSDFIEQLKKQDSNLKTIDTTTMGIVAVKNLDAGSHSSKIGLILKERYYIEIYSEYMSIPEILVLAEVFTGTIK